ncbi:hypothetical protein LP419_22570 [Massilia sp. H-1]|nr:hypothetical protein LP419_22570 [Massilia sp. H-1]
MSQLVVDDLEPVEVQEHQCELAAVARFRFERFVQAGHEHGAVGQAGQLVVIGAAVQFLLVPFAHVDIAHGGQNALISVVGDALRGQRCPEWLALAILEPHFPVGGAVVVVQVRKQGARSSGFT